MSCWYGLIVSGSSKGFGKAVALSFAKNLTIPVHFVLSGRNSKDLEQVKSELLLIRETSKLLTICDLIVEDLSDTSRLQAISSALFGTTANSIERKYNKVAFINNAGSLGPLSYIGSDPNVSSAIVDAFNVNVTACCYLTSEFIRRINGNEWPGCNRFIVVNVSSLCAIQAFDSWGVYCAGKAARDMYHKVLAQELLKKDEQLSGDAKGRILVLNYAPGPLDTDMQKEIRECPTVHKETQEYFVGLKQRNELVSTSDSAEKLFAIVEKELFKPGDHVDFFDKIEGL